MESARTRPFASPMPLSYELSSSLGSQHELDDDDDDESLRILSLPFADLDAVFGDSAGLVGSLVFSLRLSRGMLMGDVACNKLCSVVTVAVVVVVDVAVELLLLVFFIVIVISCNNKNERK